MEQVIRVIVAFLLICMSILIVSGNESGFQSRKSNQRKQTIQKKEFVTLHKWTNLEMTFSTELQLQEALEKGYYTKEKLLPVDVDIEYGDDGYHRTFLTVPRLSHGIPYSLAVVADHDNATLLNPALAPYPNYDWHSSYGRNCSVITSAIRTFIDECWRLWVVDSGQINSLQYCAPQILAFDLVTDGLLHRYVLPAGLYEPGISIFTALAVDVGEAEPTNACRDTMVYIADPWGYGLIVYDVLARKSWRIQHPLMQPDKQLLQQNFANDGIFTVSISPKRLTPDSQRRLYFHALNSYQEVSVPLHVVNNSSIWAHSGVISSNREIGVEQFSIVGTRGTQCESESMDNAGHLYCSMISSSALIAWKQDDKYNSDNLQVVAYNPEQLKFVTGLKINRNAAEEDELWALSSNPMLFVGGKVGTGVVKFRIIGCRTRNLLENERCTVSARMSNDGL